MVTKMTRPVIFQQKNSSNITQDVSKAMYLNGFDMLRNGALHDQSWAKWNMQQFLKSMQFVICQCMVCKEAWPINTKLKSAAVICAHDALGINAYQKSLPMLMP